MLAARLRLVFAEPSEGIWTTSTFSIADNGRKSKGVDGTTAAVRTADSALIYDANRNLTILEGPSSRRPRRIRPNVAWRRILRRLRLNARSPRGYTGATVKVIGCQLSVIIIGRVVVR